VLCENYTSLPILLHKRPAGQRPSLHAGRTFSRVLVTITIAFGQQILTANTNAGSLPAVKARLRSTLRRLCASSTHQEVYFLPTSRDLEHFARISNCRELGPPAASSWQVCWVL